MKGLFSHTYRVFPAGLFFAFAAFAIGCAGSQQKAANSAVGTQPGQTRMDAHQIEQVWVPAGSFQAGTSTTDYQDLLAQNPPSWVARAMTSELPDHPVQISKGFWIDKYEVTNQAFQQFVLAGGYQNQAYWSEAGWKWLSGKEAAQLPLPCLSDAPDVPRMCITWFEAEAYAHWRGGRLPTEAEWEYAARGPASRRYPWGNTFDSTRCNVVGSEGPVAVGSYPTGVSWVGAHDMAGNAMEWVQDWLDGAYYQKGEKVDPQGPKAGRVKVEKGGWWGSNPFVARSAYRHYEDPPEYGDKHIGFRVVSSR